MLLVVAGDVERNPGPPKRKISEGQKKEIYVIHFMYGYDDVTLYGNLTDDKWNYVASFDLSKQIPSIHNDCHHNKV